MRDYHPNNLKNIHTQRKMSSVSSVKSDKHTCQLCGFQTSQKTQLKVHTQIVHDGRQFQCTECEYQAIQRSSLVIHHKAVHMGQKFQCPECEHQATQIGNLVRHH